MRKIKQRIFNFFFQIINNNFIELQNNIDEIKINNGLILSNQNLYLKKNEIIKDIRKSEYKVFSQWGDDGIIDFLVNYLDLDDKKFVEFGVENYTECNTKNLLITKNWKGLIIDGSNKNMNELKNSTLYWKYEITVLDKFVNAENINEILMETGFIGDIGLFHIDVDGNDYWIWKAIKVANPIVMIVEYNSIFGCENAITIPYDSKFVRTENHYSNLYYGSSLLSLCDLADEKGYHFIGCNSNGNNAYFIRKDKIKSLTIKSAQEGFVVSKFRESRDAVGNLNYVSDKYRSEVIKGLSFYNTREKQLEVL
jgi:hypothetical protein